MTQQKAHYPLDRAAVMKQLHLILDTGLSYAEMPLRARNDPENLTQQLSQFFQFCGGACHPELKKASCNANANVWSHLKGS